MRRLVASVLGTALCAAGAVDARAADQGDIVAEAIGETLALAELCSHLASSDDAIAFLAASADIALDDAWLTSAVRFYRDRALAQWGAGRSAESSCEIGDELYGVTGSKAPGMLVEG